MLRKLLIICICIGFAANPIKAQQQTREELQKQKQQNEREIEEFNRELASIKGNKKAALRAYQAVQNKIKSRENLINNINKDVKILEETLFLNEREIYRLNKELDTLKLNYAKSLVFAYKNRGSNEYLNFLFSAQDFNDAIKRMAYLKSYRQNRETQAQTITKTQDLLQQTMGKLSNNRNEMKGALQTQNTQLKVLEEDKSEKDQVVTQLKDQEKDVSAQITKRQKENQKLASALKAAIRREIEDAQRKERDRLARLKAASIEEQKREKDRIEQERRETIAKNNNRNTTNNKTKPIEETTTGVSGAKNTDRVASVFESTPEGLTMSLNFENNRGRLPWPVDGGSVTGEFGIQTIPGTKLKSDNNGIFITTSVGATIKCVADGEVSRIMELDGEYQAVLVKHGKYFTLYNHLASVNVSQGQTVKSGTVVGKVGANIQNEGEFEFEVVNEKSQYQNPRNWLKHK
ncbi:MAG: peptidoglycan DD-metalloendopeptidase family protein [Pedobacter sp.]|nr:peptidoglycan DD-metalloendopeptidase family protein [Chitinophagaceae bacterium]